jgi:hypothetical protein
MRRTLLSVSVIVLASLAIPAAASAHQPRIVESSVTAVRNPEVSQAFYGELTGKPAEFRISSDRPFRLYVGLLLPDVQGAIRPVSALISSALPSGERHVALLDGDRYTWTPFFEEFAKDNYFWGPEFAAPDSRKGVELKGRTVPAGTYTISVFNSKNRGTYSLVIGDQETFPLGEMVHAAFIVPRVKARFFGYSPLEILASPFGWGLTLGMFVIAAVVGLIYRGLLRIFARRTKYGRMKNIGTSDRRFRFLLGAALFVWAITTSWSPYLFIAAGFCFFEAAFSWCGLYAALGKNTCPIA